MATVTLVSDAFNRADANTLGVADTGQTWAKTADRVYSISANEAAGGSAGAGYAYIDCGYADVTVQAKCKVVNADGVRTSIVFRAADANNWWLALLYDGGTSYAVYTAYYEGGVLKESKNKAVTVSVGTYGTLKAVCSGASVKVYWDDTLCTEHDSAALQTATKVGIYLDNGNLRLDDFLVTREAADPAGGGRPQNRRPKRLMVYQVGRNWYEEVRRSN
ncbi:MAG: hypothetical protein WC683_08690 [bacterium]